MQCYVVVTANKKTKKELAEKIMGTRVPILH